MLDGFVGRVCVAEDAALLKGRVGGCWLWYLDTSSLGLLAARSDSRSSEGVPRFVEDGASVTIEGSRSVECVPGAFIDVLCCHRDGGE